MDLGFGDDDEDDRDITEKQKKFCLGTIARLGCVATV